MLWEYMHQYFTLSGLKMTFFLLQKMTNTDENSRSSGSKPENVRRNWRACDARDYTQRAAYWKTERGAAEQKRDLLL